MNLENLNLVELNAQEVQELKEGLFTLFWGILFKSSLALHSTQLWE
jgi:hypothetical protein